MANPFANDPTVQIGPKQTSSGQTSAVPGAYAQVQTWTVLKRGSACVLDYFSGEHGGGGKGLVIEHENAERLANGKVTVDETPIAHDAS